MSQKNKYVKETQAKLADVMNEIFVNGSSFLNNTQGRLACGEKFMVSLLNPWGTGEFKVWWLLQRKWLRSIRFLFHFADSKDCQLRF